MGPVSLCFSTPMGWRSTRIKKLGYIPWVLHVEKGLQCRPSWFSFLCGMQWLSNPRPMMLSEDWLAISWILWWLVGFPLGIMRGTHFHLAPKVLSGPDSTSLAAIAWPLQVSKAIGRQEWSSTNSKGLTGPPLSVSIAWHLTKRILLLLTFALLHDHKPSGSLTMNFWCWTPWMIRVHGHQ